MGFHPTLLNMKKKVAAVFDVITVRWWKECYYCRASLCIHFEYKDSQSWSMDEPCKQKNKQAHTHTSSDPPSWNERTAVIAVYTTIPLCPLQGRTRMQARKPWSLSYDGRKVPYRSMDTGLPRWVSDGHHPKWKSWEYTSRPRWTHGSHSNMLSLH